MNNRAVIYLRVSDDAQRNNYSIPVQLEGCLNYAVERGYAIVGDRFVDRKSGFDTEPEVSGSVRAYADDYTSLELARPGLNALMAFLKREGADIVIVYILNRLARDSYIRQTLERQFQNLGAKTEYVLGQYDDEYGEIRKDMDATFAKWENIERVRRSREGKLRKAQSGRFVAGRAPYGYRLDKSSICGLVIDENESVIVERIFLLYAIEKYSIRKIVKTLNDEKIPSPTGKTWGWSTISRILNYEGYTGSTFYNKTESKQGLHGRTIQERDSKDWIEIKIPSLISTYIFRTAAERLEGNRKHVRRSPKRGRFYLLGGMVFCTKCKRPYVCQAAKNSTRRRHRPGLIYRHRLSEGHCSNRQLSADYLEAIVWEEMVKLINEPEQLLQGYQSAQEHSGVRLEQKHEQLKTLHGALEAVKTKRAQLTFIYSDPEVQMSREEFLELRLQLNTELEEIEKQIEDLEVEIASMPTPADLKTFTNFTAEIREYTLGNIEPTVADKRRLLELLNVKVWLDQGEIVSITGNFPKNPVSDGLLSSESKGCATRRRRFPWLFLHVPDPLCPRNRRRRWGPGGTAPPGSPCTG